MYRGNLQNTGVYDTRAARYFGEQPNWTFQAESPITCSPVVADGLVYFGTEDGNLVAVDMHQGIERWRFQLGRPVVTPPEIVGGTVYCMNRSFRFSAIDGQSGTEVILRGELANLTTPSPPAVVEQVMYLGADSGYHALDMTTGEIIRSFHGQGTGNRRPVVGDGTVTFSGSQWVEVFDLENGECTIRSDSGESLFAHELCLHNGSLYFFLWHMYHMTDEPEGLPRSLMALTTKGGGGRGYMELPLDSKTSPAAEAGVTYFGGNSGHLYAIDIQAVTMKWEFTAGAPIQSTPSIAEDLIYFGSDEGVLYVLNKETGALVRRLATASGLPIRTSPALWDGVVYFGDTGGTLYSWGSAVDTSGVNNWVVV
jgi:eukaryotic-like serine/threonine-protein kinase